MSSEPNKYRIGIPQKLLACFGAIGVIVLFIFLLADRTIQATTDLLHETVSIQMRLMTRAGQLQNKANKIRLLESELHRLSDFYAVSGALNELLRHTAAFERELNGFTKALGPAEEKATGRLMQTWEAYGNDLTRSIRAARAMDLEELTRISTFSSRPRFRVFSRHLEQLSARMGKDASDRFGSSISRLTRMRKGFMLMAVAGIAIGIVFAWRLSRSLSIRIKGLSGAAMRLADGRLDKPIPVKGRDEIAEFASVFNIMQSRVKRRENDLQKAREELESRVALRTGELGERTRELEAQASELTAARDAAEAAGRAKGEFLSNMSHELRTPLNAILGYAQILLRDDGLGERRREGVEIIHDSGEHLLTLLSDILDLSKIEAGRMEIIPGEVHLSGFLEGIVGMIRLRAEQKGLALVVDFARDLPAGIAVDAQRLRQVLINLLGNAVKFTRKGRILFRVAMSPEKGSLVHGARLLFEVKDTGVGIPEEQLARIFDPFEQTGPVRDREQGTGLGLAISKRLLDRMGSEIRVASEPGKGSTFRFELWVPTLPNPPEEVGRGENVGGYRGTRKQVLIVDDLASNRAVLRDFLAPLGFAVHEAEDGETGIETAREIKPDLILMDVVMPGIDGFEAVRRLRALPEFKETVILGVSAAIDRGEREKCREAGCNGFVPKPVVFSELMGLMEKHLGIAWVNGKTPHA